jgi:hypothetical protein
MEGGFERLQEAGANGWELVDIAPIPLLATGATLGTTFVATLKAPRTSFSPG